MRKFTEATSSKKNYRLRDFKTRLWLAGKESAQNCFMNRWLAISIGSGDFFSVDFDRVELVLECGLMSKEIGRGKKF
jgi:hypothetical protein